MSLTISRKTRKILLQSLKISNLIEVMDRDYADLDEEHDIDREKAARYASRNRGSIRINEGRFYTVKEHALRIKRAKLQKLP